MNTQCIILGIFLLFPLVAYPKYCDNTALNSTVILMEDHRSKVRLVGSSRNDVESPPQNPTQPQTCDTDISFNIYDEWNTKRNTGLHTIEQGSLCVLSKSSTTKMVHMMLLTVVD